LSITKFHINPFFSVVVPSYERPADLKICLESLSDQNQIDAPSYEIIVSDDSKSDSSKILIEKDFPHVHWGEGKKIGPAGNRNAGVARARGEWIVFLDDDCIAQEGYLNAYAKAIRANTDVLVFEGRIFADRPRRTWAEGCPENEHGGMLWTSNLCVNRKLFIEIGGLDERFKIAYEDVDFAHRLKQRSIHSVFVSDAAVCHPWRTLREKGNNWKPKSYEIISLLLFLKKHPDAREEHGEYLIYLKNFTRMMFKDMPYCLFKLRGRGVDILLSQAFISFQISLILAFRRKYNKK
jgi:GT2 family glycosyltransferase